MAFLIFASGSDIYSTEFDVRCKNMIVKNNLGMSYIYKYTCINCGQGFRLRLLNSRYFLNKNYFLTKIVTIEGCYEKWP